MDPGRRSQHRVRIDQDAGLNVKIRLAGGRELPGALVDLSGSGAGIAFDQETGPSLTVGDEADLVFDSDRLAAPISIPGRIQHRTEEGDARRYGFRFLEPQQLESILPREYRHYFTRRRAERVAPAPYEPIPATMCEPGAAPTDVHVVNLSTDGVTVSLDASLESCFTRTLAITLIVQLPGTRHPMDLIGLIRHRRLVSQKVHYGIEFDEEATDGLDRKRQAITRYLQRQDQELRKSA